MECRTRRPSVSEWLEDELDEAPRRRTRSRRRRDDDEPEGDDRLDAITSAISMLEERLDGASQKNIKSRPGRRAQRDDHDLSDVISQITGQQDALDYQFEGQNVANIQKMQNQIRDLRSVVEATTRGSSFPGMGNDIHALQQHLQQQINHPQAQQNPNFAASIEQQMLALQQRLGLQQPQGFGYAGHAAPGFAPQAFAPQAYAPQPSQQNYAQPQAGVAEPDQNHHLPVPARAQQVTVLEPTSASIEALRREVQTLRNTLRPSDPRALQVIEAEVRGLNKRLGSNGLGTASRDIAEMKTQINTLSRAVNEGGFHANNRFASTQLQQLNESISRVQRPVLPDRLVQDIRSDLAEATRKLVPLSVHDARSLEKNIQFLAERLDSLRARSPDNARLQALEGQLGRLSTQLTQSEQTLSSLQRMESSMQEISMRLSTSAHAPGIAGFDAKSAGVMRGFQKQIEDVKAATEASDKRMHQALTSLQDVMVKVAEKSAAPARPQQMPKRAMVDFGQREQVQASPKNAMTAAREAAARAVDTEEQIVRHTPRLPPAELPMPKSVNEDKAAKAVADNFAAATKLQKGKGKTKLSALDLHADAATRSLQDYEDEPKGKIVPFRHFKRYASQIALAAAGVVLVIGVYNMLGPLLSGEQTAVASVSDLPEAKKTTPGFGFPIAKPDLKVVPKVQSASLDPTVSAKSLNLKLPAFPSTLNNKTLKDAAQNGDVRAFYEIGSRLIDGRFGVQRDVGQGLEWLQLAADKQHAPALYRIGAVYEKGQGIARNIQQAIANYEVAGRLGNRKALHNLGALYASGVNGEPDFTKAFPLFKQAAELGLVDSQYNLAIVYVNGMGVKQDLIEAYKWLAIAAQNGDKESAKKRDEIGGRFDGKTLVKAKLAAQTFKPKPFDEAANEDIIPASTYADASTPSSDISTLPEGASGLGGLSGLSDTASAKR